MRILYKPKYLGSNKQINILKQIFGWYKIIVLLSGSNQKILIMSAHAEITKSRSKTKPFKVVIIAENGEPLNVAQLFTTKLNCRKNLLAVMKVFNGFKISVYDFSSKKANEFYVLGEDGVMEPFHLNEEDLLAGK